MRFFHLPSLIPQMALFAGLLLSGCADTAGTGETAGEAAAPSGIAWISAVGRDHPLVGRFVDPAAGREVSGAIPSPGGQLLLVVLALSPAAVGLALPHLGDAPEALALGADLGHLPPQAAPNLLGQRGMVRLLPLHDGAAAVGDHVAGARGEPLH